MHNQSSNAADFHTQAEYIFGPIATRYDLLCDLFSPGIHRLWKRRGAILIAQEPWTCLLDAASGTGDVVLRVVKGQVLEREQIIITSDISPQMLAIARKQAGVLADALDFRILDAHSMPEIPNESIDLYSISLGLKICDRTRVLREAMRVLKPGGRFIALEASNIVWPWLHRAYLNYMILSVPTIGWLATGGDASAYKYLLKGIRRFPSAEGFAAELSSEGFEHLSFERPSLGIVAIHRAIKFLTKQNYLLLSVTLVICRVF